MPVLSRLLAVLILLLAMNPVPTSPVRAAVLAAYAQDIEDDAEDDAEDQAEDDAEQQAEDDAEDDAEQQAENDAEDDAEQQAQDDAEDDAEQQAEDDAEDDAEQQAEDDAEDDAEQQAQDDAEDDAEAQAQDDAEDDAEAQAQDDAEDDAEQQAQDDAEDNAEDQAEDDAEDDAEDQAQDDAEDDAEDGAEDDAEDDAEDEAEDDADDDEFASSDDDDDATSSLIDLEASLEQTLELSGIEKDENDFDFASGEWLVLSTREELKLFVAANFTVRYSEELGLLDQAMSRLAPPEGMDRQAARSALLQIAPNAEIEYNHLYSPQARMKRSTAGRVPVTAVPLPDKRLNARQKIGLIDTALNPANPLFGRARIVTVDLVRSVNPRPTDHGTAVASILVGQSSDYGGLLPNARLYAASVFERIPGRGNTASTASLVRAIDWMVRNKVTVVNMSLSGPPNRILQRAISRARAEGIIVVAAAGNEGPNASPLYPAAYSDVVSVTAVDDRNRVFPRANRGMFLDFAAPGVDIRHARGDADVGTSSGTSIAAPFVSAILLLETRADGSIDAEELEALRRRAIDLGAAGRDPVYGYGLIRP